ncbi:MAG TPA: DHA2 family efflux MFS transporter permease subunit [Acidimicrobiales bacterium]|jgi:EmrB/QacA subfamily drug resistance transporter|nr:DHA2 family efflux MFS transporter permease subunit [Acidimicrobiales bacterium]
MESPRRLVILAICCMSLLIVGLDNTIVNVALPSIGRELHTSVSGLQWTVDAYTLVLASLLMLSGSMADRLGRKRTFQVGLVMFSVGSLLCSVAPSVSLLVTFRAVQAIGGSMLNPVAMSIITNTFTDRRERAQAIGVWGAVAGLSIGLGPVVGGVLVSTVGWRSIFWINVPIGILACVLTAMFIPESRAPRARRLDPVAQVLLIVVLASVSFGIIEGARRGYTSPLIVGAFGVFAAAMIVFVTYERRRIEPLIDLRFFRSAPFAGATVIAVAAFASLGGFLFLNTLYLQESRHLSALHAGLDTLPMAAVTVVLAPLSGAVVGRRGARMPLLVAGVFLAVSSFMLTGLTETTSFAWLFAAYSLFGVGFGVVNAPITNAAVSGMPLAQAGVAAAVASTSRQVGQSLGVAILGALANTGLHGSSPARLPTASHAGWWVLTGCGIVVFVLGAATTTARARASAERVAETFEDEHPAAPTQVGATVNAD